MNREELFFPVPFYKDRLGLAGICAIIAIGVESRLAGFQGIAIIASFQAPLLCADHVWASALLIQRAEGTAGKAGLTSSAPLAQKAVVAGKTAIGYRIGFCRAAAIIPALYLLPFSIL